MVPILFMDIRSKKYISYQKIKTCVNYMKTKKARPLIFSLSTYDSNMSMHTKNQFPGFIQFFGCMVKIMCFKQKMWYVSITEKWKKLDLWFLAWTLAIFMRVFMQKISHLALFTFSGHTVKKALNKIHHGAISKCWNSQAKGAEYLYIHIYIYIHILYIHI